MSGPGIGAVPAGRRRVGAGLVAVMAGVAAAEWHVVFGPRPTVPLVAGAVAAVMVALGTGSPRRPLVVTAGASLVGLVAMLLVLGRDVGPGGLLDGLLHGWSRILSTTLEVPTAEGRILLPAAVSWLAGMVGAEAALRLRTRPAAAVVPPLVAYGVALPFGAAGGSTASALVLLVLGLGTVRVLSPPALPEAPAPNADDGTPAAGSRPASTQRALRVGGAVTFVGLAAVAGAVAGPGLPGADGDPYDPRSDQRPPLQDVATIDPLSLLAGWAQDGDDAVLFTVEGPAADRWRLAVLDRYDPANGWSSGAGYVAAGTQVPAPEVADTVDATGAGAGSPVEREVTVEALDGAWLPTTGRPTGIDGLDAHVDLASAMLVHGPGLRPGLSYRLTSVPAAPSEDCSAAVTPVRPPGADERGEAVGLEILAYATAITRGSTTQCQQAERLEAYLRSDNFAFSAEAPSGANMARIVDLLEPGDDPEDPKSGTSEQFATAFALLARASGLEARVAVGFHPGVGDGRSHEVRASDAYAWAEVRFPDLGWVSFDPTPGNGDEDGPEPVIPPVPPAPTTTAGPVTTAPAVTTSTTSTTVADDPDGDRRGTTTSAGYFLVAGGGGLGGLIVVVAVAIALVRRSRRSARRKRVAAADRVIGAWRQCLVELRDAGVAPTPSFTVSDYVAATGDLLGERYAYELDTVATLANRALFSGEAGEDDAALAWRATDRLTTALDKRRTQAARLRHAFDVRALSRS